MTHQPKRGRTPRARKPVAEMTEDELIGHRIRTSREARGWTQADLLEALADAGLEMIPMTLSRIENGQTVTGKQLVAISQVLNLDPAKLTATITDEEKQKRAELQANLVQSVREFLWAYEAVFEAAEELADAGIERPSLVDFDLQVEQVVDLNPICQAAWHEAVVQAVTLGLTERADLKRKAARGDAAAKKLLMGADAFAKAQPQQQARREPGYDRRKGVQE